VRHSEDLDSSVCRASVVELTIELDDKDPMQLAAHAFNAKEGVCPVR
jgi:hypothetical protein